MNAESSSINDLCQALGGGANKQQTSVWKSDRFRTKREFDEYLRIKQSGHVKNDFERRVCIYWSEFLPSPINLTWLQTTTSGRSAIVLGHTELHNFTADVHCGFNFNLPLQLTRDEGIEAISIAKVRLFPLQLLILYLQLPKDAATNTLHYLAFSVSLGKFAMRFTLKLFRK